MYTVITKILNYILGRRKDGWLVIENCQNYHTKKTNAGCGNYSLYIPEDKNIITSTNTEKEKKAERLD